jgi:hypothetical protein
MQQLRLWNEDEYTLAADRHQQATLKESVRTSHMSSCWLVWPTWALACCQTARLLQKLVYEPS